MYCGPYSAKFLNSVLTRFRTYKIASPPQTKMTSKDDINGLGSLKFLRPWRGVMGGIIPERVSGYTAIIKDKK